MPGWRPTNALHAQSEEGTQVRISRREVSQQTRSALEHMHVESWNDGGGQLVFKSEVVMVVKCERFFDTEIPPEVLSRSHADHAFGGVFRPNAGVHGRIITDAAEHAEFNEIEIVVIGRGGILGVKGRRHQRQPAEHKAQKRKSSYSLRFYHFLPCLSIVFYFCVLIRINRRAVILLRQVENEHAPSSAQGQHASG